MSSRNDEKKKLRRLNCVNFTKTLFDFNPHRDATAEEVYIRHTNTLVRQRRKSFERASEGKSAKIKFYVLVEVFFAFINSFSCALRSLHMSKGGKSNHN